jgi:hypothetical protein
VGTRIMGFEEAMIIVAIVRVFIFWRILRISPSLSVCVCVFWFSGESVVIGVERKGGFGNGVLSQFFATRFHEIV